VGCSVDDRGKGGEFKRGGGSLPEWNPRRLLLKFRGYSALERYRNSVVLVLPAFSFLFERVDSFGEVNVIVRVKQYGIIGEFRLLCVVRSLRDGRTMDLSTSPRPRVCDLGKTRIAKSVFSISNLVGSSEQQSDTEHTSGKRKNNAFVTTVLTIRN